MYLPTVKNHPFSIEAHFKYSLVVTFAVEKELLKEFIPPYLILDTFEDKWAFITIALVDTQALRPKGFPICMGKDFFLIGYRIFVRYTNSKGKRLRGLYIVRSETNKRSMEWLGNIFTHYNYITTDIRQDDVNGVSTIKSTKSKFYIEFENRGEPSLPPNSPFNNWQEARRFAGPLPFTFNYNAKKNEMLIVEGVRENWMPKPICINDYHFDFLDNLGLGKPLLANAFIIEHIPYYWKKGKIEPC